MSTTAESAPRFLRQLGVYGFDAIEPLILASLVTEDPLLLIGRSGTGKTFLLNSISEALGLKHRHYNASMISFDDLVGFPYPDENKSSIHFLETPATVWGAQSVLIDEISRCRPEHQNRLFSLIHERKIQGMPLSDLRYRWAAMNPYIEDDAETDGYAGSEPLDHALADRFALLITVGDWSDLTGEEQISVADPAGEGRVSQPDEQLRKAIVDWRKDFEENIQTCPPEIILYSQAVTTALIEAGFRISPRRARLISRTLLALTVISGNAIDDEFWAAIYSSIPNIAWGKAPPVEVVRAAHNLAWDYSMHTGREQWVYRFHIERDLAKKVELLRDTCPDPDTASTAVSQLLVRETKVRAAAFAFAIFPARVTGRLALSSEGVNVIGKLAGEILTVNGYLTAGMCKGRKFTCSPEELHPNREFGRLHRYIHGLPAARYERALQLFYWCTMNNVEVKDPGQLERDLNKMVIVLNRSEE
ncbi:MAG: MoxR family ATPase [Chthonomonadales bacterium]